MRYFAISDLHVDFYFSYAVKPQRWKKEDPDEDVVVDTLDYIWRAFDLPLDVDGIIVGGDIANDYLTTVRTIAWLSDKYRAVYFVMGNHDMGVRGGTPSKSNLQFASSEMKLAAIRDFVDALPNRNCHLMEGDSVYDSIAGCMGMCDFLCEAPSYGLDKFTKWKRNWYDGKHWRYFNQVPQKIWAHYDRILTDIVKKKPKVVVTHFVPYELGVTFEFRNNPWNYVFYFNGQKFFEELDDDSYWICGHVHGRRRAEYVNSKGNRIHIICNPLGYPGDVSPYCDLVDYTGEKLERTSITVSNSDFILEI